MDVTREEAQAEAERTVDGYGPGYALVPGSTIEYDVGWVFFWAPRAFLETGAMESIAPGNGPILIARDGSAHGMWTGEHWDVQVDRFRATGATLPG